MKRSQIIGIGIASVCALGVLMLSRTIVQKPKEVVREVQSKTVKVLVAAMDIQLGTATNAQHFRWQEFPENAPPPGAIRCETAECATQQHAGGIARTPILANEMITTTKLAKAGEGGVLASILPKGKRAVSIKISEDTGVANLVLPNDYVDLILVRRVAKKGNTEEAESELLLANVRILAIGQNITAKDGSKQTDGKTVTLELSPDEAELVAAAKLKGGEINLSLRSITDFRRGDQELAVETSKKQKDGAVRFYRYGRQRG